MPCRQPEINFRSQEERFESAFCAAMNYIDEMGRKESFYEYAVTYCNEDVEGIYEEHRQKDVQRILSYLKEKFSLVEIELLFYLIENKKIDMSYFNPEEKKPEEDK